MCLDLAVRSRWIVQISYVRNSVAVAESCCLTKMTLAQLDRVGKHCAATVSGSVQTGWKSSGHKK